MNLALAVLLLLCGCGPATGSLDPDVEPAVRFLLALVALVQFAAAVRLGTL